MINLLYKALKMHKLVISVTVILMSSLALAAIKPDTAAFVDTSSYTSEFTGIPPFLETATGKPSVVLAFDVSGSMLVPAYPETGTSWSSGVMDNFDPDTSYFGYFEDDKKYAYDIENEFFVELAAGDWDGGFLNWLTMRRVDVARKVMIGGKVVDRDGVSVGSDTYYVLEAEREVRTRDDYRKSYALSSTVSPIPDGTTLTIADAQIQGAVLAEADTDTTTVITDKLEMGSFHQAWDLDEYTDQSTWPTVNFRNTYVDPVFVVATLSYHGQDNSTVHGHNVTTTSAQVGLAEWANANGHGAADTIYYMVAEQGCHTIEMDDGSEINFCAGNDTSVDERDQEKTIWYSSVAPTSPFGSTAPAVFAGAIMDADNRVDSTTRVYDVSSSTFDIRNTHQETSSTTLNETAGNTFHWIAIEKLEGLTSSGSTVKVFDVGSVGSGGVDYSYSSPEFDEVPFVMAAAQTDAGYTAGSPYSVRVGNGGEEFGGSGLDEDSLRVALQPNSGSTVTAQNVSAIAVKGVAQTIHIRVAVLEEPTGLVQENDSTINFGLTVYNFDHRTDNLSNIVTGNLVHGGTMNPCYPIFDDQDRWDKRVADAATNPDAYVHETTLYNGSTREYVCVPTSVHSPNDSIVQVIEDYPMIWGTTPIAESIVDVARYVRQDNSVHYTSVGGSSSSQRRFGNDPAPVVGVDGTASAGSYLWDPYYDEVQGQKLACKKVFALNFNDGAPYKDYDGSASDHPQSSTYLYDIADDSHTENEALDNVALALRQNDCRTDADIEGHQEVISYFVYAALGADEQSNTSTRRMREAAARGGFVDDSGDNLPDPMHPSDASGTRIDFNEYAEIYTDWVEEQLLLDPDFDPDTGNATLCPETEWDSDHNCDPDTFFLALDGAEIKEKLQAALSDILARVASGGAASVVSTTSSGEGAIFQSSFVPTKSVDNEVVRWYGDLQALMIDANGYLRSDGNENNTLDEFTEDPIVDTCYDKTNKVARMSLSTDPDNRPDIDDYISCGAGSFPFDPISGTDLKPLWRAGDLLSSLTDAQVAAQRGTYDSATANRYIMTALPNATGDLEMTDFSAATFTSDWVGMLDTADTAEAEIIVNYIRGLDVDDGSLRNRTFNKGESDEVVNRMGDIIYSTPLAVARPSERLNLLYDDSSYNDFFKQYRNRRTMLYVGGNDGMLHAYNGGWYDRANKTFISDVTGKADWDLGQEVWAYVPFNLLPHLKYTTNVDYGEKDGDHSYFVDQTPYIFDAQIFGDDGLTGQPNENIGGADEVDTHPNGWGTIMVVGFRTGGGTAEVYPDPNDLTSTQTVRPAFLIFDITNPELEPVLLAEFTHENLGMSLSTPTGVTVVQSGADPSTDWFLMLGSGPSSTASGNEQVASMQNAHLFLLNLKTMSLQTGGFGTDGVWDLGATDAANAFVGDLAAADWNIDETTDAVYFGTAQGLDTHDGTGTVWPDLNLDGVPDSSDGYFEDWAGKLFRVRVEPSSVATGHTWAIDVMYDAEQPIIARPGLSFDKNSNRWVHAGTGRFFNTADSIDDTDGKMFAVKEPRDASNRSEFLVNTAAISDAISEISSLMVDVTDAEVTEETGALNGTVSSPVPMATDTVQSLEEVQMAYSDASAYLNGWVKNVDASGYRGTRAMGSPTILGGFLSQTIYAPDLLACTVTGQSELYALRYTTGTAWWKHVFSEGDTSAENDVVDESAFIGVTPSMSPGVHLGDSRKSGEATMINQNSDLSLKSTVQENLEGIFSKETSWREL